MSSSVVHQNLYDLLGNTEEGSDIPVAPVNTVTKTSQKTGKPNPDGTAPAKSAPANNGRSAPRGGFSANETGMDPTLLGLGPPLPFRDGGVGSGANRRKTTDEAPRGGARGGRGARARGGRGATHHRNADDRHTKNVAPGSEKQAAQSWGAAEGEAELKDEQAGDAIAQTEKKDAEAEDAEAEDKEPEVKQVTLEAYLAEQAEKKLALSNAQSVRKPVGDDKKWAGAKPLVKEDDEDFIPGGAGKKQRERERKQKLTVDYDGRWQETNTTTERPRGGRGGARGGADRGERRGGPRGGARGGPRGGPSAAPRGAPQAGPRGGRGGAAPINPNDASAFPALGK
ncbi:hypothetical protein VPNG_03400 [Cytospora leucostoma]|uniref:Hyaluronan/mRNA-binding protein domain-containing protein n=1 Tax=Cytospora leucostoma TaxID=1230097 RepID=A0A423XFL6_9PEZI|nr:hypothetical protein VPNG_03400 [Cytospora leucostoma]